MDTTPNLTFEEEIITADDVETKWEEATAGLSEEDKMLNGFCTITIKNGVKEIGEHAFASGPSILGDVVFPNSVTSIGAFAFRGCFFIRTFYFGTSVTSIGFCAFASCLNLSAVHLGNSVRTIGDYAFQRCQRLREIYIGSNVEKIGEGVFDECDTLYKMTIPRKFLHKVPPGVKILKFTDSMYRDLRRRKITGRWPRVQIIRL